jgi:hypothetical protein
MTAPDRIWADAPDIFDDMGLYYTHFVGSNSTEYVRRDPAALAADATVQAVIGAVVEEAKAIIADFPTPHSEDVMHGHEDAYRALEVFHPDATAALARALQAERVKALEEAEAKISELWGSARYGSHEAYALYDARDAIRVLIAQQGAGKGGE